MKKIERNVTFSFFSKFGSATSKSQEISHQFHFNLYKLDVILLQISFQFMYFSTSVQLSMAKCQIFFGEGWICSSPRVCFTFSTIKDIVSIDISLLKFSWLSGHLPSCNFCSYIPRRFHWKNYLKKQMTTQISVVNRQVVWFADWCDPIIFLNFHLERKFALILRDDLYFVFIWFHTQYRVLCHCQPFILSVTV